ncbi:tagaturonate reductase [Reichenbachiella agarivorans]|uniref:Tagaturonate reductase n=1 Tax=Reichenbachiella agarivorans TaxID=2979464 RepID=A0ABY6CK49_9BACT|nr:tagaturonate reductase [Reichenbachiella agarivorans]UXP30894.1 tagaturonate reductase [Reichenbachiella agarivorans]
MRELNRQHTDIAALPIKILQFGEGNFLRAFSDWMIDIMNKEGDYQHGIAVVQPIDQGIVHMLQAQDGLYHHVLRGLKDGQPHEETRLISAIQQCINPFKDLAAYKAVVLLPELEMVISNTTEAGIVFNEEDVLPTEGLPKTFPGKVTLLLWERFQHFAAAQDKGLSFIPVELIDKNGQKLKEAILKYAELWSLPAEFSSWVENHNYFANTLVDRIVPGYPKDEIEEIQASIGFKDNLVVASEIFHLWVMEAPEQIQKQFPADKFGLNVIYTNNQAPYRTRKVRVLNGAHTSMVPVALLHGLETVRETVEDNKVGAFVQQIIFEEILPTIDLPQAELEEFANQVIERFKNPFIRHELKSIALNSIPKFKVRVLPTILDYISIKKELPKGLVTALTYLISLYLSDDFEIKDDHNVVEFFHGLKGKALTPEEIVDQVLGQTEFWDQDLREIKGLSDAMIKVMATIESGMAIDRI